jgi:hypothetical protein
MPLKYHAILAHAPHMRRPVRNVLGTVDDTFNRSFYAESKISSLKQLSPIFMYKWGTHNLFLFFRARLWPVIVKDTVSLKLFFFFSREI